MLVIRSADRLVTTASYGIVVVLIIIGLIGSHHSFGLPTRNKLALPKLSSRTLIDPLLHRIDAREADIRQHKWYTCMQLWSLYTERVPPERIERQACSYVICNLWTTGLSSDERVFSSIAVASNRRDLNESDANEKQHRWAMPICVAEQWEEEEQEGKQRGKVLVVTKSRMVG